MPPAFPANSRMFKLSDSESHFRPAATADAFATPVGRQAPPSMLNSEVNIDFTKNYYKILGVEPYVSADSIERFQSRGSYLTMLPSSSHPFSGGLGRASNPET
jgi:hypothetical protein